MSTVRPEEFRQMVAALFAKYPSASMSEATAPSWWSDLRRYSAAVLAESFRRAPQGRPDWCPSCEVVREHAEALTRGGYGQPRPVPVALLAEPEPELTDEMRKAMEEVKLKAALGEIRGAEVGLAFARAVIGGLK